MSIITYDLDDVMISFLGAPDVLRLAQVSTHFASKLQSYCQTFKDVKDDFLKACDIGNLHIAQWVFNKWKRAYRIEQFRREELCECEECGHINKLKGSGRLFKTGEYGFELYPKSYQPSGSVNLRRHSDHEGKRTENGALYPADPAGYTNGIFTKSDVHDVGYASNMGGGGGGYASNIFTRSNLCNPSHDIRGVIDYTSIIGATGPSGPIGMFGETGRAGIRGDKGFDPFSPESFYRTYLHGQSDLPFKIACLNGNLQLAQWLLKVGLTESPTPIDIHSDDEKAFVWACGANRSDLARWLVSLSSLCGDIRTELIEKTWLENIFSVSHLKALKFLSVSIDYGLTLEQMCKVISSMSDNQNILEWKQGFEYVLAECRDLGLSLDSERIELICAHFDLNAS